MRLVKAQIRDFRCVEDTGPFTLADVTCLVGKNESGKTALLRALHRLKPDDETKDRFLPDRDYPRRRWIPSEPVPVEPPAVWTLWRLTDDEVARVEEVTGPGVCDVREIVVTKSYDNQRTLVVNVKEDVLVANLVRAAGLTPEESAPVAGAETVDALQRALANVASRTPEQEALLTRVRKDFAGGAEKAVTAVLDAMIPTFLYFDQYLTLPGQVSVEDLARRRQQKQLKDPDLVFLALLSLLGSTLESLQGLKTFEAFNASLRAISIQLSEQIFEYWSQNKHLDVELRLDFAQPNDPAPFNSGWVFRTRIENTRHKADTSFDERSSGFVWFFSFLVWFNELRKRHGKNLIILLDEPGLSLHAKAQADLLRYMNERLRPSYQVVYTTHSPFMIDPDNLLSARTVEDVVVKDRKTGDEKLLGTKVGEEVLSTDADTVSPLQRALGYEMTQTLFVGRHTLLVEGASDFLYLRWFSKQLEKLGKPGLDYRWNISIVGGVDRVPGFVSLFRGSRLHVAALVDVQHGQKQKISKAQKALPERHLLTADTYAGRAEADIEDILGREFYCALVNKALRLQSPDLLPAKASGGAPHRVTSEVEQHVATLPPHYPEYNHFLPAEYLFDGEDEGAALPGFKAALGRMERLIGDVNALLVGEGSAAKS